jgi:transposase
MRHSRCRHRRQTRKAPSSRSERRTRRPKLHLQPFSVCHIRTHADQQRDSVQWVFISDQAVLHKVAPSRPRRVAAEVLGGYRPDVWVSNRYAGQHDLAGAHQVCLAHVLRDVQYAIDSADTIFAPKIHDHLRWAIGVGKRRHNLKDVTLVSYAARADLNFPADACPVAHPAGKVLLKQVKAWRTKFFVFLTNRDVPAPTPSQTARSPRPCSAR